MDLRTPVPLSHTVAQNGVEHLDGLIEETLLAFLGEYVRLLLANGTMPLKPDRSDIHWLYGDPAIEVLLSILSPRVAPLVGNASPSFGYLRVYTAGSDLPAHVDREACDFTLTVCLAGMLGGSDWPLHAEIAKGVTHSFAMPPGDGVMLRGREVRHWREPLQSGWAAYAFLHWVDAGSGAARFDGRPGLGFPAHGRMARHNY